MLYNRIGVFRAERQVSRKALAEATGVNVQTIGYLERGDYFPSLELALKIARFFGVPVELVFSLEPFEPLSAQVLKSQVPGDGVGAGSPSARPVKTEE